ncbi:low-density lipoprotein receptor domain class a [Plakobranchus ocellatus]|uniref:Low-density lipoprotein receptor domain class a n=1 Tax=Plakobranchus ocellatus TaxID=259542 RepID=A0AAV4CSJ2_9GAST|nr:low-density lipoprotein receptor domain class a [Plakobranchus ocellatus]
MEQIYSIGLPVSSGLFRDRINTPGSYRNQAQMISRTDSDGPVGRGFKYIITAFSDDQEKFGTCGASFECDNHLCIDRSLTCDGVDNCGDSSDEAGYGRAKCEEECGFICKFLTLGVTASIFISVGSIVICLSCLLALVCCLRRVLCRKSQDAGTIGAGSAGPGGVVTTATTVSIAGVGNGGGPSSNGGSRAPSAFSNHGYSHAGYYPLQPVAYSPAHASSVVHHTTPHGSVYSSYGPQSQHHHHHHHHHHSAGAPSDITQLAPHHPTSAPPGSAYTNSSSSQGAPSHGGASIPRPYTPPSSSKSGRSGRSNNSTSVTYSQGADRVALPVHL